MYVKNINYKDIKDFDYVKNEFDFLSKNILIQIFTGIINKGYIKTIQKDLKKSFPNASIIGTTTASEIYNGKVLEKSTVVSISKFDNVDIETALFEEKNSKILGQKIAKKIIKEDTKVVITFLDGTNSNGENYIKSLNHTGQNIIIAGGMAGDNGNLKITYVFDDKNITSTGAVACSLNSKNLDAKNIFSFNWQPIGKSFTITKAKNNILYEIDNIPALDLYFRYFGKEILNFPLATMEIPIMIKKYDDYIARACIGINKKEKSLIFAGDIKEGDIFQFGFGDTNLIFSSARKVFEKVSNFNSEVIYIYSCVARKALMGNLIEEETKFLNTLAPTSGFFTYGEFFHFNCANENELLNQTLTFLSLSEKEIKKEINIKKLKDFDNKKYDQITIFKVLSNFIDAMTKELEISNEKLKYLSETDQLTKIYNRRKILEILKKEIERSRRFSIPLSLIMVDIDFFKKINDNFGHLVGDQVLIEFANILKQGIRKIDYIGRWGGEEFLIILIGDKKDDAVIFANRLKNQIENHKFPKIEKLTASFGITQLNQKMNAQDLVQKADIALYKAKKSGRNCVVNV